MNNKHTEVWVSFGDKEYRDAYVRRQIPETLALQIRALREARHYTQEKLGDLAGMRQEAISRLEDPEYGSYTISTLTRLASAFDVGFLVQYVPFGDVIDRTLDLTPEELAPPSFAEEHEAVGGSVISGTYAATTTIMGAPTDLMFSLRTAMASTNIAEGSYLLGQLDLNRKKENLYAVA